MSYLQKVLMLCVLESDWFEQWQAFLSEELIAGICSGHSHSTSLV